MIEAALVADLPLPLTAYSPSTGSLVHDLASRLQREPFNGIATATFALAVLHTFSATRFTALAHRIQHQHESRTRATGRQATPSIAAELLHFLGEIEVVFGLWAVVLLAAMTMYAGWQTATHYLSVGVNYTEPMFVVVIMGLASTRPVIQFAESALRRVAGWFGGSPAAWWMAILTVGPILGSFITEPAAMTICALLLARQFFDLQPSTRLKYATLGVLFVNVSIGGTLTNFAAPPVLMVARAWNWDMAFMATHFGGRAAVSIAVSTMAYFFIFKREFRELARRAPAVDVELPDEAPAPGVGLLPSPGWLIAVHLLFMAWTVFTSHYPALFVGGFLFFLGVAKATSAYQNRIELKTPLLVGFFLAGLVIHGGLQAWWIEPVLGRLPKRRCSSAPCSSHRSTTTPSSRTSPRWCQGSALSSA